MKWFQGSIAEAVAASKAKEAIFVVFVEGKDEQSQQIAQSLNTSTVSSRLESNKFVAIKLQSDSENYTFFAQIYHLVPVPSIFFIGDNGVPLEVIGNPLSPSELATKIDSISLKANSETKHSSADLINAEQTAHSSSSQGSQPKIESEASSAKTASDVPVESPASTSAPSSSTQYTSELSPEEKLLRVKKLIELQQKQKAEEEEKKERERELERRRSGKDIQKLKQQQQDREIREAQEERQKEKAAEQAAKERVLRQIAEDKLERKRKYEMHQQEKASEQKKAHQEAQARTEAARVSDNSKARIQFKLPTGNTVSGVFEATSTLGSLRSFIRQEVELPFRNFSMSAFFPRKDFTPADDIKTLLELELVPSAVILILPIKNNNSASVIKSAEGSGIFSYFIWTLLAPVVSIYNYVTGYFTGRPRGGNSTNNTSNTGNPINPLGGRSNIPLNRLGNLSMRRVETQRVSKLRNRGNVHTLRSVDNDDDENNTWNGNSTQQM